MKSFKILASALTFAMSVSMLCACNSISNAVEENDYVSNVSADFNEIVNINRELSKIRASWQAADKEASEKYLQILDNLSDTYLELRNCSTTSEYQKIDQDLDDICNTQLTYISQEKALVQYTYSSEETDAYKSGIEDITQNYTSCYNKLDTNISYIKTICRNK